jgi:hypothetical protein
MLCIGDSRIPDCRRSWWLIIGVRTVFVLFLCVVIGDVANILEVYAACIIRVAGGGILHL